MEVRYLQTQDIRKSNPEFDIMQSSGVLQNKERDSIVLYF